MPARKWKWAIERPCRSSAACPCFRRGFASREKQPLNFPSAGSTFKRPEGHFAGALIEAAGLKGLRVGGAQVSEKHAGCIVNRGGATARDVLELIAQVQARVQAHAGVLLETEVRIVGDD